MLAYGIKVYLTNGDWGYVTNGGDGKFYVTKNEGSILCFPTMDDAREFYVESVRNSSVNGVPVDTSRTAVVRVNY